MWFTWASSWFVVYQPLLSPTATQVLTRVVEMLERPHALMGDCQLSHAGGLALAKALTTNCVIRKVDLRNNGLAGATLEAVLGALAKNLHIEEVGVRAEERERAE